MEKEEIKGFAGIHEGDSDWVYVLLLILIFSNPYFKNQETEDLKLKVAKLEAKEELLEKVVLK